MSIKRCLAYDKACKKVLCDKKIIPYLLKLCVEEYQNLNYDEIEKLVEDNEELGVLNELFVKNNSVEEKYRNLEEKYGIKLNEEGKRKVETMMNLGEGLVQKTRMQSLEEGRKEGRTEGMQVKTIEFIKRIMKSRNFSYEQVVKHLELTEEEEKQYQEYFM